MRGLLAALVPPPDEWALRRDGTDWLLETGSERARLRNSGGLGYLRALLAAPGHEIPSVDVVADGVGLAATAAPPPLDQIARESYRRRLAALADELDTADTTCDATRAARADTERQALLDELRRATGLGGRAPRRVRRGAARR
jgi:hypothetical protein